jgi:class 3 adenylate cyclase/tetratricopeptide (TPR) repeat protein
VPVCPACGKENPEGFQFCGFCAAPLIDGGREQRKTVTVLFCDLTGSTALGESTDPEALRALLARYFDRMRGIVESHGGTVEKFIGDAVMAVFGVPQAHEDDGLRACRAAMEMHDALPELGVEARIGINTGEVVAGTRERLATGDAVNVAARLEQAAKPGQILIGEDTLRLVRDAVQAEPVDQLELKGKSEPVVAYQLISVTGSEGFTRRLDAPMVGRDTELRRVRDAFEQTVRDRSCQLFTILGAAGVGKSRLVAEFANSLDTTLVVRGRCLPYGEGITYWPVVEVLNQLPAAGSDFLAGDTVRALLRDEQPVSSSDEIAWAFRKLLEAVASSRALVCVFDDLHWGEETFLDLVEHVADLSRDAPILLLCMARPDLLDRRSGWAGGKVNATNVLLEPLGSDETELLIGRLAELEPGLRARIREASEGNPLFVEEMVALVEASGDEVLTVPPTIQALLIARLDQLDRSERDVLQCAAVEGRVFHVGVLRDLTPEEPQLNARLTGLVRKELIRPDAPEFAGEDAYRFRHLLIRDAAYDSTPKATRAVLHERFAGWLQEHQSELAEPDEVIGYHLEQAWKYRAELRSVDDLTRALARNAAARLGAAGKRAFQRRDAPAAVNLISRAAALLAADDPARIELVPNVRVVQGMGGDLAWADRVLSEALVSGDEQLKAHALVQRGLLRLFTESDVSSEQLIADAEGAIDVFRRHGDELGLARAWRLIGQAHYLARRAGPSVEAADHALVHARRAGNLNRLELKEIVEWLGVGLMLGPTPAPEAFRRFEPLLQEAGEDRFLIAELCSIRANLAVMCDRETEAKDLFARARGALDEHDLHRDGYFAIQLGLATPDFVETSVIEDELRASCQALEAVGDRTQYSSVAAVFARILCARGHYEEAEHYTRVSEDAAGPNDVASQILWRSTRGRALAHRGELEAAELLAREAVRFATESDFLNGHADALMDLAEVQQLSGRIEESVESVNQALLLYERKGNVASASRAREGIIRIAGTSASRQQSPGEK